MRVKMAGMRDAIIHDYMGGDLRTVSVLGENS